MNKKLGMIIGFILTLLFMSSCSDNDKNKDGLAEQYKDVLHFKASRTGFETKKQLPNSSSRIEFEDVEGTGVKSYWQLGDIIYIYEEESGNFVAQFNAVEFVNENDKNNAYFVIDKAYENEHLFEEKIIYKAVARTGDANGFSEAIDFTTLSYDEVIDIINSFGHVNEIEFKDNGTLGALGENYIISSPNNLEFKISKDNEGSFINTSINDEPNYIEFANPYAMVTLNVKLPETGKNAYNPAASGKIQYLTLFLHNENNEGGFAYTVNFNDNYVYDSANGIKAYLFVLPGSYEDIRVSVAAEYNTITLDRRTEDTKAEELEKSKRYTFTINENGDWEIFSDMYLWMLSNKFKEDYPTEYATNLAKLQHAIESGIVQFDDDGSLDPKKSTYAGYDLEASSWINFRNFLLYNKDTKGINILFPSMLSGFSLTDPQNSFNGLLAGVENISSIDAPVATGTIGDKAFYGCSGLETANFPLISEIGSEAFKNNTILQYYSNESPLANLTSIGGNAFSGCTSIQLFGNNDSTASDEALQNLQFIGGYAFKDCKNLVSFGSSSSKLPALVEIEGYAFAGCSKFENFGDNDSSETLNNLTTVGPKVFQGTGITQFAAKSSLNSLTTLTVSAFEGMSKLERFGNEESETLLAGINTIGDACFQGCSSLEKFAPLNNLEQLTTIGNNAFNGTTSLVQFGNNKDDDFLKKLKTIGSNAFISTAITQFAPASVLQELTDIGASAFKNSKLEQFTTNYDELAPLSKLKTIGESAFENCANLTEFIISNPAFNTFNKNVFYKCEKLKFVECKENIMTIFTGSFSNCAALTQIGQTPNVISLPYLTDIESGGTNNIFRGCTSFTFRDENNKITGGVILDLGSKLAPGTTIKFTSYNNVFGPTNVTPNPNKVSEGVTIKLGEPWIEESNIGISPSGNQKYWMLQGGKDSEKMENNYKVFNIIGADEDELPCTTLQL